MFLKAGGAKEAKRDVVGGGDRVPGTQPKLYRPVAGQLGALCQSPRCHSPWYQWIMTSYLSNVGKTTLCCFKTTTYLTTNVSVSRNVLRWHITSRLSYLTPRSFGECLLCVPSAIMRLNVTRGIGECKLPHRGTGRQGPPRRAAGCQPLSRWLRDETEEAD